MANIDVSRTDSDQLQTRFSVRVSDDHSSTAHSVTLSNADYERWGDGHSSPEDFVRTCMEFLLEREPKERIFRNFDVSQIPDYFRGFDKAMERPDP